MEQGSGSCLNLTQDHISVKSGFGFKVNDDVKLELSVGERRLLLPYQEKQQHSNLKDEESNCVSLSLMIFSQDSKVMTAKTQITTSWRS